MNAEYGRNVANDDQVREWAKALRAERALADDLADVLTLVAANANTADAEVERVLARYREARQR